MKSTILTVFIGLLGASTTWAQDEAPAFPPAKVQVASAEIRNMAPVVEASGTVMSLNDSRIAAEVEGVLTWMADVGDAVDAGAVIARIDPRLMRIEQTRAQANVARLEADLHYREQLLARSAELALNKNVSANLLDESKAQRDQALYQLADARAQLDRAEGDLKRTRIRAAFAGHVTERLASVGEYIGVGEDVVRLVDTNQKEIALPAAIAVTAFVQPGLKVRVRNGRTEREHEVRAVVPVGDAVSRMVEIRLKASDSDWLVGSAVQVSLPADDPVTAVAVPRDAMVERGGESYLFRISDDGTAEQVPANIESTVGLWVGLADGIEPGDRIVVRGAERLAPGQAVEVLSTEKAR
ncbi:MAG: efflux RND transporter periplasmic adaptor subunit [Woeseiaceae bacterium]